MVGETLSRDFARLGDINKSVGVVGVDDVLDLIDLFLLYDADEHIVFDARIESDCFDDGYATVEFLGD